MCVCLSDHDSLSCHQCYCFFLYSRNHIMDLTQTKFILFLFFCWNKMFLKTFCFKKIKRRNYRLVWMKFLEMYKQTKSIEKWNTSDEYTIWSFIFFFEKHTRVTKCSCSPKTIKQSWGELLPAVLMTPKDSGRAKCWWSFQSFDSSGLLQKLPLNSLWTSFCILLTYLIIPSLLQTWLQNLFCLLGHFWQISTHQWSPAVVLEQVRSKNENYAEKI